MIISSIGWIRRILTSSLFKIRNGWPLETFSTLVLTPNWHRKLFKQPDSKAVKFVWILNLPQRVQGSPVFVQDLLSQQSHWAATTGHPLKFAQFYLILPCPLPYSEPLSKRAHTNANVYEKQAGAIKELGEHSIKQPQIPASEFLHSLFLYVEIRFHFHMEQISHLNCLIHVQTLFRTINGEKGDMDLACVQDTVGNLWCHDE